MSATMDIALRCMGEMLKDGDAADKHTAEILEIVMYARWHGMAYGVLWDLRTWRNKLETEVARVEEQELADMKEAAQEGSQP